MHYIQTQCTWTKLSNTTQTKLHHVCALDDTCFTCCQTQPRQSYIMYVHWMILVLRVCIFNAMQEGGKGWGERGRLCGNMEGMARQ